jgi:hypothetical protein
MGRLLILCIIPAAAAASGCMLDTRGTHAPEDARPSEPDIRDSDAEADMGELEVEIPVTCGDRVVDPGEECDDGNAVSGDGCEITCRFSCHGDDECMDGSVCNGSESCDMESHACVDGVPGEDGFVCIMEPRWICLEGVCEASVCGDGFVDVGGGEFCEPGLADPACQGDCTYACMGDGNCPDDGDPCNGAEYCNPATHHCGHRDPAPGGTDCDDGFFCTDGDACDGSGHCVGRDTCDDGLDCTTDSCDEGADRCANPIDSGRCRIGGVCYDWDERNPANECQECEPGAAQDRWSPVIDRTACNHDNGVCCGGTCRVGGDCCYDHDCPAGCTGVEQKCELLDAATCESQAGCTLSGGACGGMIDCSKIDASSSGGCASCGCAAPVACPVFPCYCEGTSSLGCATMSVTRCEQCSCTLAGATCSGTHYPCSTYVLPVACGSQLDCRWGTGACTGYVCM